MLVAWQSLHNVLIVLQYKYLAVYIDCVVTTAVNSSLRWF
jgi:hypothetical protein